MSKMKNDPRIDPRIKAVLGDMPAIGFDDVESRPQALDEVNTQKCGVCNPRPESGFEGQADVPSCRSTLD